MPTKLIRAEKGIGKNDVPEIPEHLKRERPHKYVGLANKVSDVAERERAALTMDEWNTLADAAQLLHQMGVDKSKRTTP